MPTIRNMSTFTDSIRNDSKYQIGEILYTNVKEFQTKDNPPRKFKTIKVGVISLENGEKFYGDLHYPSYKAYFDKYGVDLTDSTGYRVYFSTQLKTRPEIVALDGHIIPAQEFTNIKHLHLELDDGAIAQVEWVE